VVSAFRPCGRDLVEFFNNTGWAFPVNLTALPNFRLARHPTTIADLTLPTRSRIAAIEFFLSRQVGAPSSKSERRLPHSGKVRNAISTTRCNLPRLAPPAAWTAIP
jgi:hypothetical protein